MFVNAHADKCGQPRLRSLARTLTVAAALSTGLLPGAAHAVDGGVSASATPAGGVMAHVGRIDFNDQWGQTVDWSKLDRVTRELAPDRLDWNALCVKVTGKGVADFPDGLPRADAERFMTALAQRLKEIAAASHSDLSQNDLAIVACAVIPMQQVKGAGQKYVTSLGDTSRLGTAIIRLTRTGVNCGDGCVLARALLQALNIESRFVGCHRKISLAGQPAGHAMIEYFETGAQGRRFGHIVDATNLAVTVIAGEPRFRPAAVRFQLIGDRLGRMQFLVTTAFLLEQPAQQGFDPPFSQEELASPDLIGFTADLWDRRLDTRSVTLNSVELDAAVPEGKSIVYTVEIGKDVPEGSMPSARLFRKGPDGEFHYVAPFPLRRRAGSSTARLVWDAMVDGLTPGDYRADFYIDDGSAGYGRRGVYAGTQAIRYGVPGPPERASR